MSHSAGVWHQLNALGAQGPALLGVVALSALAQAVWFVRDSTQRVDVDALGLQIRKLIEADNVERAIKLTQAIDLPVLAFARVGLEARVEKGDLAAALQAVQPQYLVRARKGLRTCLALAAVGLSAGVFLIWGGITEGFGAPFALQVGGPVAIVVALGIRNILRWGRAEKELNTIANAVADL